MLLLNINIEYFLYKKNVIPMILFIRFGIWVDKYFEILNNFFNYLHLFIVKRLFLYVMFIFYVILI